MSQLDLLRLCAQTCSAYFVIVASTCVCRASHPYSIHSDSSTKCDDNLIYQTRTQGSAATPIPPSLFSTGDWRPASTTMVELLRGARIEAHLKWIDDEDGPMYVYFDTQGSTHGSGRNRSIGQNAQLLIPPVSTSYDITRQRSLPLADTSFIDPRAVDISRSG